MACNNGKKGFHSPYGMITDLNITYTGCSTTCNGEEIKPGMRLREILDILIGNCAEGGSATWGDIIGNIEDQTDLVQFIQDNVPSVTWGNISGDIADQEDLVQFVQENGFGEDKIGSNLHLDGDGKVNLGVDTSDILPGETLTVLSFDGNFPSGGATMVITDQLLDLNSNGGDITQSTYGGDLRQNTGGGDLTQIAEGGRLVSRTTGAGDVNIYSSDVVPSALAPGTVSIRADTSLMVKTQSSGVNKLLIDNNVKINPSAEYPEGMPSSPSDNVLPTIGYVRDTLISDAITAAITPLVQQISDLEDRVQTLEDAAP